MNRYLNKFQKSFLYVRFLVAIISLCTYLTYSFLICNQTIAKTKLAKKQYTKNAAGKESRIEGNEGMVWIPKGNFRMGCSDPAFPDARPIHKVKVSGFWLDKTVVTNEQFAKFVQDTKYVTIAERSPSQEDFPNVPAENLKAGSLVFKTPSKPVSLISHYQWWQYIPGANWRHPEGPESNIKNRMNHPVVHIAWQDAVAYANWASKRLPTEAEFEYAARGGLDQKTFSWGDELKPGNKWSANIWQGNFPFNNTQEDGFLITAPVASFPANGFGLYDMTGNVWQWCSDWYRVDYYKRRQNKITVNPQGPTDSYDPKEPVVPKRVQRGGSFLCSDQYCARYLVGARGKGEPNSSSCHVGFRCARNANQGELLPY